jgi:hypothetical protein
MKKFLIVSAHVFSLAIILSAHGSYADSQKQPDAPPEHLYMKPKQDTPMPKEVPPITGKILETMNSGGYTYLYLDCSDGKKWAAVRETEVTVGQEISLLPGHEMINFTSKSLNRTFDKIIFSSGPASHHGHGTTGNKDMKVTTKENINIEKAAGANSYKIDELFGKSAELNKKAVAVKGKVVKVSAGIMAKNWIHLQDGSGDPANKNHDLVVTTQDLPAVGDVVTASGTLYKDKDFGSGYKYNVIVEDASIKKE